MNKFLTSLPPSFSLPPSHSLSPCLLHSSRRRWRTLVLVQWPCQLSSPRNRLCRRALLPGFTPPWLEVNKTRLSLPEMFKRFFDQYFYMIDFLLIDY